MIYISIMKSLQLDNTSVKSCSANTKNNHNKRSDSDANNRNISTVKNKMCNLLQNDIILKSFAMNSHNKKLANTKVLFLNKMFAHCTGPEKQISQSDMNIVLKRKGLESEKIVFKKSFLQFSVERSHCPMVIRLHKGNKKTKHNQIKSVTKTKQTQIKSITKTTSCPSLLNHRKQIYEHSKGKDLLRQDKWDSKMKSKNNSRYASYRSNLPSDYFLFQQQDLKHLDFKKHFNGVQNSGEVKSISKKDKNQIRSDKFVLNKHPLKVLESDTCENVFIKKSNFKNEFKQPHCITYVNREKNHREIQPVIQSCDFITNSVKNCNSLEKLNADVKNSRKLFGVKNIKQKYLISDNFKIKRLKLLAQKAHKTNKKNENMNNYRFMKTNRNYLKHQKENRMLNSLYELPESYSQNETPNRVPCCDVSNIHMDCSETLNANFKKPTTLNQQVAKHELQFNNVTDGKEIKDSEKPIKDVASTGNVIILNASQKQFCKICDFLKNKKYSVENTNVLNLMDKVDNYSENSYQLKPLKDEMKSSLKSDEVPSKNSKSDLPDYNLSLNKNTCNTRENFKKSYSSVTNLDSISEHNIENINQFQNTCYVKSCSKCSEQNNYPPLDKGSFVTREIKEEEYRARIPKNSDQPEKKLVFPKQQFDNIRGDFKLKQPHVENIVPEKELKSKIFRTNNFTYLSCPLCEVGSYQHKHLGIICSDCKGIDQCSLKGNVSFNTSKLSLYLQEDTADNKNNSERPVLENLTNFSNEHVLKPDFTTEKPKTVLNMNQDHEGNNEITKLDYPTLNKRNTNFHKHFLGDSFKDKSKTLLECSYPVESELPFRSKNKNVSIHSMSSIRISQSKIHLEQNNEIYLPKYTQHLKQKNIPNLENVKANGSKIQELVTQTRNKPLTFINSSDPSLHTELGHNLKSDFISTKTSQRFVDTAVQTDSESKEYSTKFNTIKTNGGEQLNWPIREKYGDGMHYPNEINQYYTQPQTSILESKGKKEKLFNPDKPFFFKFETPNFHVEGQRLDENQNIEVKQSTISSYKIPLCEVSNRIPDQETVDEWQPSSQRNNSINVNTSIIRNSNFVSILKSEKVSGKNSIVTKPCASKINDLQRKNFSTGSSYNVAKNECGSLKPKIALDHFFLLESEHDEQPPKMFSDNNCNLLENEMLHNCTSQNGFILEKRSKSYIKTTNNLPIFGKYQEKCLPNRHKNIGKKNNSKCALSHHLLLKLSDNENSSSLNPYPIADTSEFTYISNQKVPDRQSQESPISKKGTDFLPGKEFLLSCSKVKPTVTLSNTKGIYNHDISTIMSTDLLMVNTKNNKLLSNKMNTQNRKDECNYKAVSIGHSFSHIILNISLKEENENTNKGCRYKNSQIIYQTSLFLTPEQQNFDYQKEKKY